MCMHIWFWIQYYCNMLDDMCILSLASITTDYSYHFFLVKDTACLDVFESDPNTSQVFHSNYDIQSVKILGVWGEISAL